MRRKTLCIVLVAVILLIVGVAGYAVIDFHTVKSFSLQDYDEYMDGFAKNEHFVPYIEAYQPRLVEDAETAKQIAEELFVAIYEDAEKPYLVCYDETEGVWLVTGSKNPFALGGVANILIHKDGTILAIWHGK